jgi:hypothetical protein
MIRENDYYEDDRKRYIDDANCVRLEVILSDLFEVFALLFSDQSLWRRDPQVAAYLYLTSRRR